jgi:ribosome-binding protein aMBF1 (putative translation factor)
MNRPQDLLAAALLRIEVAQDTLKAAHQAVMLAMRRVAAEEGSRLVTQGDGWPQDPVAFGAAIRKARELKGWTRDRLAEQVNVAVATIRNVETARHLCNSGIRARLIKTLAPALS